MRRKKTFALFRLGDNTAWCFHHASMRGDLRFEIDRCDAEDLIRCPGCVAEANATAAAYDAGRQEALLAYKHADIQRPAPPKHNIILGGGNV